MNRREFCRTLALIVGATAMTTAQIDALERVFLVSSDRLPSDGVVAIQDLYFGFDSPPHDDTATVTFADGVRSMPCATNTRGSMRCCFLPNEVWLTTVETFQWTCRFALKDLFYADSLQGWVMWLDSDGRQHQTPLKGRSNLRET